MSKQEEKNEKNENLFAVTGDIYVVSHPTLGWLIHNCRNDVE
jgi:hypothetical protein